MNQNKSQATSPDRGRWQIPVLFGIVGPAIGALFYVALLLITEGPVFAGQMRGALLAFLVMGCLIGIPFALLTGAIVASRRRRTGTASLRFTLALGAALPVLLMTPVFGLLVTVRFILGSDRPFVNGRDLQDLLMMVLLLTPPSLVAAGGCWGIARWRRWV